MYENYYITGYFYDINYRKILEIKLKNSLKSKPDLIVIMMNPGGSRQKNHMIENSFVETIPDKTQNQIIEVMCRTGKDFARILNLSDYRCSKSSEFLKKLKKLEETHSIFCDKRIDDIKENLIDGVPIILAWGVDYRLRFLAEKAYKRILEIVPNSIIVNDKHHRYEYAFRHPLPRTNKLKYEWVNNISNALGQLAQVEKSKSTLK
ncbi:DUF1643 domain-containing protein [Empedobacter falsenii]